MTKKVLETLKLLCVFILTGVVCGLVGVAFSKSVTLVTDIRNENGWILYLLPLAGVLSVGIYKLLKVSGIGTNNVIKATEEDGVLSVKITPAIFLSSCLSHLCGASVGREGAALQLGGGSALLLSKGLKLKSEYEKILIYCGMAGVFSSVFGTPLAAAVFALEVIFVGKVYLVAVIPTFITSFVSFYVAHLLGAHAERFNLSIIPNIEISVVLKILILGLLSALMSIIFCLCLKYSNKLFKKLFKNEFLRIIFGGVAIILLTLLVGTYDYNGAGINVIERIFEIGEFNTYAFLFKILFTCVAVGTGFKGGEIVPTLFVGATFGALIGSLLGLPVAFAAAICMIALFCGVTNCPLASLLLGFELFSGQGIGYMAIAVIITFCLSGKISLYSAQKTKGFKGWF